MAYLCDNCGRKRKFGRSRSHAQNESFRFFRPNLQKLRVLKDGVSIRVLFCTSCIQKLKKAGKIGVFSKLAYATVSKETKPVKTVASKKHVDREAKKISEIVEKEQKKLKAILSEEVSKEVKRKKETIKIEELVGKK